MRAGWLLLALAACDDGGTRLGTDGATGQQATDARAADAGAIDARPPDAAVADARVEDAAAEDAAPDAAVDRGPPPTIEQCFGDFGGGIGPDYTPYAPVLGHHCLGTNHQAIDGVQRLVFLGDSVTAGTPPTQRHEIYRARFTAAMQARFGADLEVASCAKFGARTDDFLREGGQIPDCFPEGSTEKRTLVVFTMGGNDIAAWASDAETPERAMELAEEAARLLDEAVAWFKAPGRFPNGVFVIYANPYEFTDATGDLESCEWAQAAGFSGNWIAGVDAVVRFNERFMETAVRHQVDMIFTLESFCGHGFHADDPASPCYRGPGTEVWFDVTCIHPNPTGHQVIADMFRAVVEE